MNFGKIMFIIESKGKKKNRYKVMVYDILRIGIYKIYSY